MTGKSGTWFTVIYGRVQWCPQIILAPIKRLLDSTMADIKREYHSSLVALPRRITEGSVDVRRWRHCRQHLLSQYRCVYLSLSASVRLRFGDSFGRLSTKSRTVRVIASSDRPGPGTSRPAVRSRGFIAALPYLSETSLRPSAWYNARNNVRDVNGPR